MEASETHMKFPPATLLKPLDLARTPKSLPRPLSQSDLSPAARLTKATPSQHDRLVGQAQKWVAQTFFGTLLKQMDESPFKSDLFSGGRGGQAFSTLYHQQLADRMARGAGQKLVNSIVRRIEAKLAYQKQQQRAEPRGTHGRRDVAAAPRA
jgi:Rod binding domain-containing protein